MFKKCYVAELCSEDSTRGSAIAEVWFWQCTKTAYSRIVALSGGVGLTYHCKLIICND